MRLIRSRKSITMHAYTGAGGQFSLDIMLIQFHFIVIGLSKLIIMTIWRSISILRTVRCSWIQLHLSLGRHNQNIPKVGMSCSREMRMTKTNNGWIIVLITCTVFIYITRILSVDRIRDGIGFGAQLYRSKRNSCPRKGMPHFCSSDQWFDILAQVWLLGIRH